MGRHVAQVMVGRQDYAGLARRLNHGFAILGADTERLLAENVLACPGGCDCLFSMFFVRGRNVHGVDFRVGEQRLEAGVVTMQLEIARIIRRALLVAAVDRHDLAVRMLVDRGRQPLFGYVAGADEAPFDFFLPGHLNPLRLVMGLRGRSYKPSPCE
ncbi:MAG: hypothetical protein E5X07_06030 [Mesorhizobium sp.]|nr:MAG: hypothetical protein E5X07_06030 [Mesorhizobium sp.]